MTPRRITTRIAAAFAALTLTLGVASSAAAKPKGPHDKRAQVEQRIKQARGEILRKHVGLDDAKAKEVEAILDKHAPERKKLQGQMREARKTVRALLQADSNDQAAYARAIADYRSAEKKLDALREKEYDELAKKLTPKQQAKLVVAIRKMQGKIRQHMRKRGGGGDDD